MKSPFNSMEAAEIEKRLVELRMQAMKLKSELSSKAPGKNIGQLRKIKKSIAQALTALTEKKRLAALEKIAKQEIKEEGGKTKG